MLAKEIFDSDLSNLPADFVFQQDGASIHTARSTKKFLSDRKILVLPFPPYSLDLNIIENLWGIVSHKIYGDGKEYHTSEELWECVYHTFLSISDEVIAGLYQSMTNRLIKVIENKGKRTNY